MNTSSISKVASHVILRLNCLPFLAFDSNDTVSFAVDDFEHEAFRSLFQAFFCTSLNAATNFPQEVLIDPFVFVSYISADTSRMGEAIYLWEFGRITSLSSWIISCSFNPKISVASDFISIVELLALSHVVLPSSTSVVIYISLAATSFGSWHRLFYSSLH